MIEFIDIQTGQPLDRAGRLRQSVTTILTTPVTSEPMRREFGSNIFKLIDKNVTATWLTSLYAEAAEAISRWEPDFQVTGFEPVMSTPGNVAVHIHGVDTLSGTRLTLENITL
ncbi:GPW/gp25 family protein [Endozoicomonas ascidiicola]|uniref:GPW/gp25 family protein n=1 Tax=Endozoicomonas ascidiicola TaxID=1698521 RepID=UPI0008298136|nr:GPW/gp25 family protein [Endozoicomonas ascidiicola]